MTRKFFHLSNPVIVIVLLLTSLVSAASAADQRLTRVTSAWDGSQTDGGSTTPTISADGRFVVFNSLATNIVEGGQASQLYLYDRKTGSTELVSLASDGSPANYEAYYPAISSDGRFIAFGSNATNLAGELPGEIYLRDRKTGETVLVSGPVDGSMPSADANGPSISGSGRFVAFLSFSENLVPEDTDILPDIYVRDMQENTLHLASVSSSGEKGNSDSGVAGGQSISRDGRYVAFQSYASNLVAGDTNEVSDVFIHDRSTGKTERISVSSSGQQANAESNSQVISGSGRYVGFTSAASNLVPGDTNGVVDVFVYDRQTHKTERVSVSSTGSQQAAGVIYGVENFAHLSISDNGRYITFVSQATNFEKGMRISTCDYAVIGGSSGPCANIYLHDRQTGKTSLLSAASKKQSGNSVSYSPAISPDGNWVAFGSDASNLVSGDTNGQADIFLYHQ